jgi:acetyl-CoA carboxylase carboxyl transferase subunit alpha
MTKSLPPQDESVKEPSLTAWERVLISRHPERPHTTNYIQALTKDFVELHGDRASKDDPSVVGGFATIDGMPFMIIGQEKGKTTEERVLRNFGMLSPEGFRKGLRLMRLAERFQLPILVLLDTPGAYCGLEAEEKGQGKTIAENLQEMFSIKTPILVVIIGEGCSGGALGLGVGDSIAILEHAYYSVISPEGCASILWKDASRKQEAASALKLTYEYLLPFHIVDTVLQEPHGGAHKDPQFVYDQVKNFALEKAKEFGALDPSILLERRYQKFRALGSITRETP